MSLKVSLLYFFTCPSLSRKPLNKSLVYFLYILLLGSCITYAHIFTISIACLSVTFQINQVCREKEKVKWKNLSLFNISKPSLILTSLKHKFSKTYAYLTFYLHPTESAFSNKTHNSNLCESRR